MVIYHCETKKCKKVFFFYTHTHTHTQFPLNHLDVWANSMSMWLVCFTEPEKGNNLLSSKVNTSFHHNGKGNHSLKIEVLLWIVYANDSMI
jgi:hypothetical protein